MNKTTKPLNRGSGIMNITENYLKFGEPDIIQVMDAVSDAVVVIDLQFNVHMVNTEIGRASCRERVS
jgi:hypothetical protein